MEDLPADPILKFHPNTLEYVREIFGLNKPGRMDEAINILEEWVEKQNHFVKRKYPREYLERTIIATKGSVERAKTQLDKICTLRTLVPTMFGDYNLREDFKHYYNKYFIHSVMPKLTSDHYRIFALDILKEFESKTFMDYYRIMILYFEYMRLHDYPNGLIYVVDFSKINVVEHSTRINPVDLRQIVTLLIEGYGVRMKGIHLITPSKFVDVMITILKQVLSAKLAGRIFVHKSFEALHEVFDKDILPKDFGGNDLPLNELHEKWLDVLTKEENRAYQREMNAACTDEVLRQKDKFNEQYLGMPGSFRTLNVD